jgi:hypothetical protein
VRQVPHDDALTVNPSTSELRDRSGKLSVFLQTQLTAGSKVAVRFLAPLPSTAETEALLGRTGVRPRCEEHPGGPAARPLQLGRF